MDLINALLTLTPSVATVALQVLTGAGIAYLGIGFLFDLLDQSAPFPMSFSHRLECAWDNLKFTVKRELRETHESILAKAYASARLVKLLGSWAIFAALLVTGLPAFVLGLVWGPVSASLAILKNAFVDGAQRTATAAEHSFMAVMDAVEGRRLSTTLGRP